MAVPSLAEQPPPPPPPPVPPRMTMDSDPPSAEEFDALPIPPMDLEYFSAADNADPNGQVDFISGLPFSIDDDCDFDITFDDFGDADFFFPSENESFIIREPAPVPLDAGDFVNHQSGSIEGCPGDCAADLQDSDSPASGNSGISGDHGSEVEKYLNSEGGSCNLGDQSSDSAPRTMNIPSPVSSQGSGNGGSGLSDDSGNLVVDQKVKVKEEIAKITKNTKSAVPKRKKDAGEETIGETRSQKFRRAENVNPNSNINSWSAGGLTEEEEKRRARLVRNRESAQLSRQRKKHYVEELEDKVRSMHSTIAELNSKISFFIAENASLRQQLTGASGMCPPPPAMYPPMAPYPWVPCAPYVVKPQGSQVPLVPIPRLKPQQPVPAAKPKKAESKKSESRKGEGKTKKVASVTFLGFLFFILLFGGLVPMADVKFGGLGENGIIFSSFGSEKFYNQHRGRVLTVDGHSNGSHENKGVGLSDGRFGIDNRIHCEKVRNGCPEYDAGKKGGSMHFPGSDGAVPPSNSSEQLVASLYVPRNDKLVKIDGNLIIHSVLASERAMASSETPEVNNKKKETSLAIPSHLSPALAIPGVGSGMHTHVYQQKALTSGSAENLKDHLKSSAANGKLQQWFHEGLAGPLLSSGMCTEVFQFDVSPSPGAIVPASSVGNVTAEQKKNATLLNRGKNRRTLHGLRIPLTGSDVNITGEHAGRNSKKSNFHRNKTNSSMVVSVLVDPREAGDSGVEGMISPKSFSRIFVVVLLDSVKYVTYSCGLPRPGPHLVTT